jgi:hypothetical protein
MQQMPMQQQYMQPQPGQPVQYAHQVCDILIGVVSVVILYNCVYYCDTFYMQPGQPVQYAQQV